MMNTNFYKSYVDELRDTMQNGIKRGELKKANNFAALVATSETKLFSQRMKADKENDEKLFESLNVLNSISGKKVNSHLRPGEHPEFRHLKEGGSSENHYICSVFIDVKKSTNLFAKYEPVTVANIINTIQRAAIHTTWQFDGYVQRYHGDGLFAYFGGKNIAIGDAVKQALSANSFLSYFMRNDLKKLFNEQGIEDIYTRIGIDVGEAADVLWYKAGIGECSEITTCSLHTSLACKMQGAAKSNGIVLGDHIKNKSLLPADLFDTVKKTDGTIDYYAFKIPDENFLYRQWDFKWETYLKNLPGIKQGITGELYIDNDNISLPSVNTSYLASQASQVRPYYK